MLDLLYLAAAIYVAAAILWRLAFMRSDIFSIQVSGPAAAIAAAWALEHYALPNADAVAQSYMEQLERGLDCAIAQSSIAIGATVAASILAMILLAAGFVGFALYQTLQSFISAIQSIIATVLNFIALGVGASSLLFALAMIKLLPAGGALLVATSPSRRAVAVAAVFLAAPLIAGYVITGYPPPPHPPGPCKNVPILLHGAVNAVSDAPLIAEVRSANYTFYLPMPLKWVLPVSPNGTVYRIERVYWGWIEIPRTATFVLYPSNMTVSTSQFHNLTVGYGDFAPNATVSIKLGVWTHDWGLAADKAPDSYGMFNVANASRGTVYAKWHVELSCYGYASECYRAERIRVAGQIVSISVRVLQAEYATAHAAQPPEPWLGTPVSEDQWKIICNMTKPPYEVRAKEFADALLYQSCTYGRTTPSQVRIDVEMHPEPKYECYCSSNVNEGCYCYEVPTLHRVVAEVVVEYYDEPPPIFVAVPPAVWETMRTVLTYNVWDDPLIVYALKLRDWYLGLFVRTLLYFGGVMGVAAVVAFERRLLPFGYQWMTQIAWHWSPLRTIFKFIRFTALRSLNAPPTMRSQTADVYRSMLKQQALGRYLIAGGAQATKFAFTSSLYDIATKAIVGVAYALKRAHDVSALTKWDRVATFGKEWGRYVFISALPDYYKFRLAERILKLDYSIAFERLGKHIGDIYRRMESAYGPWVAYHFAFRLKSASPEEAAAVAIRYGYPTPPFSFDVKKISLMLKMPEIEVASLWLAMHGVPRTLADRVVVLEGPQKAVDMLLTNSSFFRQYATPEESAVIALREGVKSVLQFDVAKAAEIARVKPEEFARQWLVLHGVPHQLAERVVREAGPQRAVDAVARFELVQLLRQYGSPEELAAYAVNARIPLSVGQFDVAKAAEIAHMKPEEFALRYLTLFVPEDRARELLKEGIGPAIAKVQNPVEVALMQYGSQFKPVSQELARVMYERRDYEVAEMFPTGELYARYMPQKTLAEVQREVLNAGAVRDPEVAKKLQELGYRVENGKVSPPEMPMEEVWRRIEAAKPSDWTPLSQLGIPITHYPKPEELVARGYEVMVSDKNEVYIRTATIDYVQLAERSASIVWKSLDEIGVPKERQYEVAMELMNRGYQVHFHQGRYYYRR